MVLSRSDLLFDTAGDIRRRILARRDLIPEIQRHSLSGRIVSSLKGQPEYAQCRLPLFYLSFRSEVVTHELVRERIESGLPVAAPVTLERERKLVPYRVTDLGKGLRRGAYGILEPDPVLSMPVQPREIDLVLAPGSVFDRSCGRLGYGGGFYDRFLNDVVPWAVRVGLAFSLQIVESLPLAPHDQPMDLIVTESSVMRCARERERSSGG